MASARARALEQPAVEVASGTYKVVSTLAKVQTEDREELHNLTRMVQDFVKSSGLKHGSVTISSLHTTSGVFIGEWQEALIHDVKAHLAGAVRRDEYYRHNDPAWSDCERQNADSHLRTMLLGMSLTLQVAEGDVVLGEWQSIIMAEFDGPRERSVRLQVMGIGGH